MGSFISVVQLILKLIDLFQTIASQVRQYLYNRAIEQINKEVSDAQKGTLEERMAAAKRLEDLINKHAPRP